MGSGIIPENPILNSDRRDSRASQRSGSQPPTQLPTQPVSQMYQPPVQNTVPPLQLHKESFENMNLRFFFQYGMLLFQENRKRLFNRK